MNEHDEHIAITRSGSGSARLIAYIDDYKFLMIATLTVIPLLSAAADTSIHRTVIGPT